MKNYFLTFILIIGISIIGNAQTEFNEKEMVGFACAYGGEESKSVKKFSRLIDKSKYRTIIKLLDSNKNAEKYLAVIILEKLSELGIINLSNEQNRKILKIYDSKEMVSVCSGCSYYTTHTLEDILDKENIMRQSAKFWLDYKFKPNKI